MDDADRPRLPSATPDATSPDLTRRSSYTSTGTSRHPMRAQPSAFRLRRLIPSRSDDDDGDSANPQHVRSMLDVDGGAGPSKPSSVPFRLLRAGSKANADQSKQASANPQNVQSMLDVDDNEQQHAAAQRKRSEQSGPAENPQGPARDRPGRFMRVPIQRRRAKVDENGNQAGTEEEYDEGIIDMLDVVDPEVATLSSITNVQNSLFVPSMGRFVNRRPTYNLTRIPRVPGAFPVQEDSVVAETPVYTPGTVTPDIRERPEPRALDAPPSTPRRERDGDADRPSLERIPSTMTDRFYAVRPHNTSLADWSDEDLAELNDHVRHMLHSRRSAFKRGLKAFGQYVRKPLGFLVTLYATLITLFGLAWVLFLIGWIYVGEKQLYVINVIDNVLVALFAIVGDGMIPWRAVDTYHMIFIARYHHLTWKLREKMAVPDLKDKNDLPSEPVVSGRAEQRDLEAARTVHTKAEYSVLTPKQQATLEHHQTKFAKSHTFYKPHETETHYAFPLRFLVAIVVLLDCHSCFQIALGLCTWCIDYRKRPGALTATILSCSIAVNTTAGILISVGDRRTRKKDVVERMFRQELTEEAMRRMQHKKEKEEKEAEKAEQRLEKIDEGDEGRSRTSFTLPKPREFLSRIQQSDDSSFKTKKSGEYSRKSLDRVGRFDALSRPAPRNGDLHMSGAFPEED